jgi:D-glycero-D-manno-heptose 1,7-bisphosphate phosphatase
MLKELPMKPAIFLDRDGTLNKDCPYCKSPNEIVLYGDIFQPLKELSRKYYIIIITNQSGISRGYFTKKDLLAMHEKVKKEIKRHGGRIDAIYYCPHLPGENCRCRKPGTGMMKHAMRDFNIDLSRSFMVGDDDKDILMARDSGVRSIRVRSDNGSAKANFYAKDFNEVLKIIKDSEKHSETLPKAALILAGGHGTRMRPFTYRMPKPMARANGKPIIEHIIRELVRNEIREIYISVGYKTEKIMDYLGTGASIGAHISYVAEKEPLGTGGGIRLALQRIKKEHGNIDVLVTNGDDLFKLPVRSMYAEHKKRRAMLTIALRTVADVTGTGVALLKGARVIGFMEKPEKGKTSSRSVSLGKYICNTSILNRLPRARKFSFESDFLEKAAGRYGVYGFFSTDKWYPVNTMESLKKVNRKRQALSLNTADK